VRRPSSPQARLHRPIDSICLSHMSSPSEILVLVTGGSGFVGVHCIIALLNAGYKVRTTVRALSKQDSVREMLKNGDVPDSLFPNVSFVAADLMKDEGWADAVAGCTYVLHVASPFPSGIPKHEHDLIVPARDGTLRVLRASKIAGVKRVVVTSSFAAIGYGHPPQDEPFTEASWTNLQGRAVTPYVMSKTIAETAAWDFVKSDEGNGLELAVVNPVGIFGPVLGKDLSTSVILVERLLDGSLPGLPHMTLGVVDVRDVASLHLLAMTSPKAVGERFLAISPPALTFQEIALILKKRMPPEIGRKIPTRVLPNFLVRIVGFFNKEVALALPELGKKKDATNLKAKSVLGWNPRSAEDALAASGESLIKFGVIKK